MNPQTITFQPRRRESKSPITVAVDALCYIIMHRNYAEVHLQNGKVFTSRITMEELEQTLGADFLKVHRSCLVAMRSIHSIEDKIILNNGERLVYVVRQKKALQKQLHTWQKALLNSMEDTTAPANAAEYHDYYKSFDAMPFAFTDIEMVFDDERHAIDWIFRYGNPALAQLEKLPLETLIDHSFGTLFANMDSKWLRSYERAVLYGETLEIVDYSPEIDTHLKITCFPTFKGHCACILFNVADFSAARPLTKSGEATLTYLSVILGRNS